MKNQTLTTKTKAIAAEPPALFYFGITESFPLLRSTSQMKYMSGVGSLGGRGGMPGVTTPSRTHTHTRTKTHTNTHAYTHTKMRSRWLFFVCTFVLLGSEEGKKREERRTCWEKASLHGHTFTRFTGFKMFKTKIKRWIAPLWVVQGFTSCCRPSLGANRQTISNYKTHLELQ